MQGEVVLPVRSAYQGSLSQISRAEADRLSCPTAQSVGVGVIVRAHRRVRTSGQHARERITHPGPERGLRLATRRRTMPAMPIAAKARGIAIEPMSGGFP
jgi:hypothetical protein